MGSMLSTVHRNGNDQSCAYGCCHNSKFHTESRWKARKAKTRRAQRHREARTWRQAESA